MDIQKYFEQALTLDKQIDCKLEQITVLRNLAVKATSVFSDTPPSGTRNIHKMEDAIIKANILEEEIVDDMCSLLNYKRNISCMIKKVDNPEYRLLLELRYLCLKPWDIIASDMRYDLSWIHKLHKKALNYIEKIENKP